MKRSSVFYAKIGPRLSPKLFAMRDFLTACELLSGIIGRHLSKDCLPCGIHCGVWIAVGNYRPPRSPKIVCRAGFLATCGLYSGIIGRHAPRRLFAVRDSLRRVDCVRGSFAAQENYAEKRYFYDTGGAERVVSPPPPRRFAHRIGFFTAAHYVISRFGPYLCNTPKGIDYILYNTKIDLL